MTNTPISRIPFPSNDAIRVACDAESQNRIPPVSVADIMSELDSHADGMQMQIQITLDWAMQIREATQRDWEECIDLAMIFYFG